MISPSTEIQRKYMVEQQLIKRGIQNKSVLNAFLNVPRENFVLPEYRLDAYQDNPLPIISGQTISQPFMAALMTELIHKEPPAKILDVGTGSGYQTAILAYLGFNVISIEKIETVANFAKENLKSLQYTDKIKIIIGDGTLGYPDQAPFDGIIVSGACPQIPKPLLKQLAPNGKLCIPCGSLQLQNLLVAHKDINGKNISISESIPCRFVPIFGQNAFKSIE